MQIYMAARYRQTLFLLFLAFKTCHTSLVVPFRQQTFEKTVFYSFDDQKRSFLMSDGILSGRD